jgi:hypothetical protein
MNPSVEIYLKTPLCSRLKNSKIKLMPDDRQDHNGESVEYWAAVLQQYPVSEEYLRAIKFKHNGDSEVITQVSPELLVQLEKEIDTYINQARDQLNQSKRFDEPDSRHLRDVVNALVERLDFYQEIDSLLRSESITLLQLVDAYRRDRVYQAQAILENAHKNASFLNDIRTGHASKSFIGEHPDALNAIPNNQQ